MHFVCELNISEARGNHILLSVFFCSPLYCVVYTDHTVGVKCVLV